MARKPFLDRWSEEETAELRAIAEANPDLDALEIAAKHVDNEKYKKRSLDAVKQRVFKMRREAAAGAAKASPKTKQRPEVRVPAKPLARKPPEINNHRPLQPRLRMPDGVVIYGTPEQIVACYQILRTAGG